MPPNSPVPTRCPGGVDILVGGDRQQTTNTASLGLLGGDVSDEKPGRDGGRARWGVTLCDRVKRGHGRPSWGAGTREEARVSARRTPGTSASGGGTAGQRPGAGRRPVGSKKSKEPGEPGAGGQVGSGPRAPRDEGSLGYERRER